MARRCARPSTRLAAQVEFDARPRVPHLPSGHAILSANAGERSSSSADVIGALEVTLIEPYV